MGHWTPTGVEPKDYDDDDDDQALYKALHNQNACVFDFFEFFQLPALHSLFCLRAKS